MNEYYGVLLNEVPDDSKVDVSSKLNFLTLSWGLNSLETLPKFVLKTHDKQEAEAYKQQLENTGADVELVTYKVNEIVLNEGADFVEIINLLNEKAVALHLLEEEVNQKIREQDDNISKVRLDFEQLKPELDQLGQKILDNAINLSSGKSIDLINSIEETKLKLLKEREARSNREEEAKKGFWNRIKSSVGNFFDNVEIYEKELSNHYIDLAKTVIKNKGEVELVRSIASAHLIDKFKENYAIEAVAKEEKAKYEKEKLKIHGDLKEIIKIGEEKLNLCLSFEEFENVTSNLNKQVKEALYQKAKEVLPEKSYPYVKNKIGDAVALIDNYVLISKGKIFKFTNFFDNDANVVKIPIESITAIQFKESGIKDGFIEFLYLGYFPKHNQVKHAQENVISFRGKNDNEKFKHFKEIVEKQMRELKKGEVQQTQSVSVADELEKFAKLYQQGFITEEEFAAKKAKILGL